MRVQRSRNRLDVRIKHVASCASLLLVLFGHPMATCDQPAPGLVASVGNCASEKLQDNAQQIVQLMGRANNHKDCQHLVRLLYASRAAPFVYENFWHSDDEYFPDVLVHLEFRCSHQNLSRLCWALEAFLQNLCNLPELDVLADTLTFSEDYTGQRLYDHGTQHPANMALRFYDRVKSVA